jgi:hypothetical protein
MTPQDFDCFKMAFNYVQQHRFARIKQAVSELHLVGQDGNIDSDYRMMLLSVYKAVKQGLHAVEDWERHHDDDPE